MAETHKNKNSKKPKGLINKIREQYSTDPFFIKKRELSLKLIQKAGLPDSFVKK